MLRIFVFICVLSVGLVGQSQIELSDSHVTYGEITADTDLEKEVFFVNTGSKDALLLTSDFPREYNAHISSKSVAVGDTIYLRWKFTPFVKGRFTDKITLWFSTMQEPIDLKISGNVEYIDKYANPACPNFNQRPAGQEKTFDTEFLVIEDKTHKAIPKASLKIVDSGIVMGDYTVNRNGEKSLRLPIRYYYFLADAEGYESVHLYSYVNSKNHRFVFEMKPLEDADQETEVVKEEPTKSDEIVKIEDCDTIPEVVMRPEEKPLEEFDSRIYAPNNIVFLVDVSGSMAANGRLEILKASMIELVRMMRPEDKISLVSYARSANVLLEPTSGAAKAEIIDHIRNLYAKGATSGEKGLKRAYTVAKSSFISDGNNRVYIATDGVFKPSETEAIDKLVKKNKRRKIYLSVLGIKGTSFTEKKMAELALIGEGEFVALEDFDSSADKLINLVKNQSRKE